MSRIFITGSSDGLGLMAAQLLVEQGHSVVLHARNVQRTEVAHRRLPGAEAIVTGDLATLQQMRSVADEVNARLRRANRCKSHAISKTEVGTDVTERSGVFVHFDLGTT
jgi:NAD(P)-dependent dehydrogenase (short-subunit alcohol dehydrogenase family)